MADPELESKTARLIHAYVEGHFEMSAAVTALVEHGASFHLTGGAVRSAILAPASYGDLDLIVRGGDRSVADFLLGLGLEQSTTRYGDARFYWNRLAIDLMATPAGAPYDAGMVDLLHTFDLCGNAIGFDPRHRVLVDPLNAVEDLARRVIRINRSAWEGARPTTLANQCIRLAKLLHETPGARLAYDDLEYLTDAVVPQLETVTWDGLKTRFPTGRTRFLELFRARLAVERRHGGTGGQDPH